jgi:hypothetical protein
VTGRRGTNTAGSRAPRVSPSSVRRLTTHESHCLAGKASPRGALAGLPSCGGCGCSRPAGCMQSLQASTVRVLACQAKTSSRGPSAWKSRKERLQSSRMISPQKKKKAARYKSTSGSVRSPFNLFHVIFLVFTNIYTHIYRSFFSVLHTKSLTLDNSMN